MLKWHSPVSELPLRQVPLEQLSRGGGGRADELARLRRALAPQRVRARALALTRLRISVPFQFSFFSFTLSLAR